MTYDKYQYRVKKFSLGGECRRCGGSYTGPKWERSCINCGYDPDEYVPVELDLQDWWSKLDRENVTPERVKSRAKTMWELGVSQKVIAETVGVHRSTVSKWASEWQ